MTASDSVPDMSASSRTDPLILTALTKVLSKAGVELADVDIRNLSVNLGLIRDLVRKTHWLQEDSSLIVPIDAEGNLGSRFCSYLWVLCSYCRQRRP